MIPDEWYYLISTKGRESFGFTSKGVKGFFNPNMKMYKNGMGIYKGWSVQPYANYKLMIPKQVAFWSNDNEDT